MKRFVTLDKPIGQTPLMAVQEWKKMNPEYAEIPAAYAGRLDPMASGKLLILLGEECKRQKSYTNLDKAYEIEVLLNIGSDTGDVLGLTSYSHAKTYPTAPILAAILAEERGAHSRAYPAFSSKTVDGTPLFHHTLAGTLDAKDIPTHLEQIHSLRLADSSIISHQELKTKIASLLDLVPLSNEPSKKLGKNFRIDAVRAQWESTFTLSGERDFTVLRLRVVCASGTYMRSLAGRIGTALGTRALALSIRRTAIGRYLPLGRFGFWIQKY